MTSSIWKNYSYGWLTLAFFVFSFAGHWLFGWFAYVDDQSAHGQPLQLAAYTNQMLREMFENWQSEFLQLLWQVGGLAYFVYRGSPQSKDDDQRQEEKIDALLKLLAGPNGEQTIKTLDEKYPRA